MAQATKSYGAWRLGAQGFRKGRDELSFYFYLGALGETLATFAVRS